MPQPSMPLPTVLFHLLPSSATRSVTWGIMLSLGLWTAPVQAQFGELLPPAGTTPPSTGTIPPNTNPFDLPTPTTPPGNTVTPQGSGLTPPGGGLTPAPNNIPPLPEINLPTVPGTPATPGNPATTERAPTADETARAEKAKKVSELIRAEKYAEAEAILHKELEENPKDAGAWFFLAGSQRLQDKLDDAIVSYTKAIEYLPEYGDAYLRRGIVWFKKGDYAVAALDFEFASGLNYNDPRPEMWRGLALSMIGQTRLAISAHSAAIKFDSLYVPARVNRGLAYMELQDYVAASIDFSEAIRLEPSNAQHYFKRGVALAKRGLADRAVSSYNEAIRLDPKYAEAYYNRGVAYSQLGKSAEASRDRAQALQLNPSLTQSQR
jgi:Flp pilus assembly protein TadD